MSKRRATMWFQLPVDAGRPPLVSETAGITRIVARTSGTVDSSITLLDSDDARLLRAGVIVAHRILDDRGHWYVSAPLWPGLPNERSYDLSPSRDLPDDLRARLDLFLRGAPIAPLATIDRNRRAFVLRSVEGEDIVEVRDDIITVQRDGATRSRVREVGMTPLAPLTAQQREFIHSAMAAIDATPIDRVPTLQQRIGPPATGLSSFREPQEITKGISLEDYVSEIFVAHLGSLVLSELADDRVAAHARLAAIERDLRGLSSVLEPESRASLEAEVHAVLTAEGEDRGLALRSTLDGLVSLVRAPKLGDLSGEPARYVLFSRAEQALMILFDRCRALSYDSPDDAWRATFRSAEQLEMASALLEPILGKPMRKARDELTGLLEGLGRSVRPAEDVVPEGTSAQEAYELGRSAERANREVERARRDFIDSWADRVPPVRKSLTKIRKKLA